MFLRLGRLVVPVGILVQEIGTPVAHPLPNLLDRKHHPVLIDHVGIERGIDPNPLVERRGIDDIDNVTVIDHLPGHAGHEARLETHRQIAFVEDLGHHTTVDSPVLLAAHLDQINRVARIGIVGASVVTHRIVHPVHQIPDLRQFVAAAGDAVQVEILPHPHQIAVVGIGIAEPGKRIRRRRGIVRPRLPQDPHEIALLTSFFYSLRISPLGADIVQIGIFDHPGVIAVPAIDIGRKARHSRPAFVQSGLCTSQVVIFASQIAAVIPLVELRPDTIGQCLEKADRLPVLTLRFRIPLRFHRPIPTLATGMDRS